MGRCSRKRDGSGELAAAVAKRRRETAFGESEISTSSVQLKTRRSAASPPENEISPENSVDSGSSASSCCSSGGSSESPGFADLKENAVAVEYFATSAGHSVDFRDRRENSPSSEVQTESGELESTAGPPSAPDSRRTTTAEKMPTEAELEEFFAAAEKNIQKQFLEKYNYDIVKDEPVEGRYEWVPVELKP
ncbi:cyclin dependent kinase inhibitor [Striga asiatica]|uniref:Cyclin-dependent kinase inhibitor n=1 Tax=Striga asiatica TaxID=4170 RepID=A0A5A7PTR3_STRAF|nr:cyclin dependent kinase inhibitor [Striga asiatica]